MAFWVLTAPRLPRPFAGINAQSAPTGAAAGRADTVGRADAVGRADLVGRADALGRAGRLGVRLTGPAPPVGLATMVVDVVPQAADANTRTPAITANRIMLAGQECSRMSGILPRTCTI